MHRHACLLIMFFIVLLHLVLMWNARKDTIFTQNGLLHREDGPAIIRTNGDKFWYQHGALHRDGGPAVELANGDKFWYKHGELHRDTYAAIIRANGDKEWYNMGRRYRRDGGPTRIINGLGVYD